MESAQLKIEARWIGVWMINRKRAVFYMHLA